MKFFLLVFLVLSCSRLNTVEREAYDTRQMRHGIVPLSSPKPTIVKKEMLKDSILRGQELYKKNCLECHGERGRGDGHLAKQQKVQPANLQRTLKEVAHFEFYLSISQLQGEMPGWRAPLDHRDREDIINYLRTFVN
ncbi:MAG: cytochrome c [Bacteriovoracia bacterium]